MKIRRYLILFIASIICFHVLVMLRKANIHPLTGQALTSMVGLIGMFFITFLSLRKSNNTHTLKVLLVIWVGISIFEVPVRILAEDTLGTLHSYIYWCLGILLGLCFCKAKTFYLKVIIAIVGLIIIIAAPPVDLWWQQKYSINSANAINNQNVETTGVDMGETLKGFPGNNWKSKKNYRFVY